MISANTWAPICLVQSVISFLLRLSYPHLPDILTEFFTAGLGFGSSKEVGIKMVDETVESGWWWTVNPLSTPAELGVTAPQRILIRFSEHAHEPRAYLDRKSPLEMFIARLFRFGPSFFVGFGDWTVNSLFMRPPFSSQRTDVYGGAGVYVALPEIFVNVSWD